MPSAVRPPYAFSWFIGCKVRENEPLPPRRMSIPFTFHSNFSANVLAHRDSKYTYLMHCRGQTIRRWQRRNSKIPKPMRFYSCQRMQKLQTLFGSRSFSQCLSGDDDGNGILVNTNSLRSVLYIFEEIESRCDDMGSLPLRQHFGFLWAKIHTNIMSIIAIWICALYVIFDFSHMPQKKNDVERKKNAHT